MDLWAWIRLLRPTNSFPAVGLVLLGAYLAAGWPWPRDTWMAAGAMWAITSFGYVTNDLCDVVVDRVNKPDRPLPSGRVRRSAAYAIAGLLAALAIGLAATIDWLAVLAACLTLVLLFVYNVRLKSTVLVGNSLVAILSGSALGVGSYTVGRPWAPVWPGVLVACFILAREVLKTIEDVVGDHRAGVRTIATAWGTRRAGRVFAALALVCVGLSLIAYRWAGFSPISLAFILSVDLGLIYSAWLVGRSPTPAHARVGLRLSKMGYALGLVALLLARGF